MVFNNNLLLGAAGQGGGTTPFDPTLIGNSAWFDGSADYLSITPSTTNRKTYILGGYIRLHKLGSTLDWFGHINGASSQTYISISGSNKLAFYMYDGSSYKINVAASRVLRDFSWYHLMVSVDTTQATASDRVKLYVNGEEITDLASTTYPSLNTDTYINSASHLLKIGNVNNSRAHSSSQLFLLDGVSIQNGDVAVSDFLDTFTFGTNGSQHVPKADADIAALATTAGGNSFCLDFADSANLGNDISSNANDFTVNSMSSVNQSISTPSLVFPTFSFLNISSLTSLSEGNLRAVGSGSEVSGVWATRPISAGEKIYFEGTWGSTSGWGYFGVSSKSYHSEVTSTFNSDSSTHIFQLTPTASNRGVASAGSALFTGQTTWTTTDTFQIAIDINNGKLWFGVNDSWYDSGGTTTGDPAAGTNPTVTFTAETPMFVVAQSGSASSINVNFGQDSQNVSTGNADENGYGDFEFAPPSGFLAFCSANLPTPDYQGIDYFDATLYEGNGQNQRVGDFVPFTDTFTVSKSAMFDNGDRRYLARTYSAGDTARSGTTCTISYWIKYCSSANNQYVLSTSESGQTKRFIILIDSSGNSSLILDPPGGANNRTFTVPGSFLSEQEWTNFVWQVDPDNATAADKVKAWVNGVQITSTDTSYQSASSSEYYLFDNEEHFVGNLAPASAGYTVFCLNSYLAELNVLDGQLKAPTDFGEVDTSTNRWVAKDYNTNVGTYGNRGFYMEFLNPTGTGNGVGTDSSGNGFNFTESFVSGGSAWTSADQFTDTPSKNYATYDTVKGAVYTAMSMSDGNLTTKNGDGSVALAQSFPIQDGYWYYEVNLVDDANNMVFGLYNPATTVTASTSNPSLSGIQANGTTVVMQNNGGSNSSAGPTLSNPSAGDVVGIYIRKVGNNYGMWFSLNGTAMSNTPAATETATPDLSFMASIELVPVVHYSNPGTKEAQTNFGQFLQFDGGATSFNADSDGYWKHAPVTGFKAINQDNLDDTASKITALAWIKNRDATDNHMIANRVRGPQFITNSNSNSTGETTNVNAIQRFLQRGVQVGSDVNVNTANESYVLWQWLMGDSATTGTTTSPAGSIASTTIVADAGHMSIGTFTGTGSNGTVGHGLSAAPEAFVVFNPTVAARFKMFYHKDSNASPASGYIHLESTEDFRTDSTIYNNTVPTSTVFSVGTNLSINESGALNTFIAWRSVPGVCKVGSYTGNGNANGPYIDLGFKPAFFMAKQSSAVENWIMLDNQRPNYNPTGGYLFANLNNAEGGLGNEYVDFLSSGVKLRTTGASVNGSASFIYIAMADIGGNGTLPPIYGK